MAHPEFSKEITAVLVIDPYNEFISARPPSIDNRTARIRPVSSLTPELSDTRTLVPNGVGGDDLAPLERHFLEADFWTAYSGVRPRLRFRVALNTRSKEHRYRVDGTFASWSGVHQAEPLRRQTDTKIRESYTMVAFPGTVHFRAGKLVYRNQPRSPGLSTAPSG
jgi:hypothetical protein